MNREKEERLQREMFKGETVEWSGEPKPSAIFTTWDVLMVPCGIFWCLFSVYWVFILNTGISLITIWGAFFFVAGIYMIFVKYIVRHFQNKHMIYAVTDCRILVLSRRSTLALDIKDVSLMLIKEKRDGSGSLDFEYPGASTQRWGNGMDIWGIDRKKQMKFRGINNVKLIHSLISEKIFAAKQL